ncbi:PH domain-containing protein [Macrococcus equi]|uniref:PH domain-containing protein n=1 Tax=Macrococcus equi TaxID=3395462 RepID=UPI0039BE662D
MKKMHRDSLKLMKIGACLTASVILIVLAALWFVQYKEWIPVHPYVFIGIAIIGIIFFILDFFIFPKLTYDTSLFQLGDEEIITVNGIWNKEKRIVPYVTIQNVELEQGPIMKRFNIKSLKVITAESDLEIEYIHETEAEHLKRCIHTKMLEAERKEIL